MFELFISNDLVVVRYDFYTEPFGNTKQKCGGLGVNCGGGNKILKNEVGCNALSAEFEMHKSDGSWLLAIGCSLNAMR
ncbi:hypothetical protein, partial [Maribacter sp.]|uniref:hypothetical protein n=1 Tax=Maribacter sp. TaxID=1897614 RepID=UPI003C7245BF